MKRFENKNKIMSKSMGKIIKEIPNAILLLILILLLISQTSSAQKTEFRKIENNAFKVGEKLRFDVKYGFVTAGIAEFAIPKMTKIAGRNVFNITFNVNSVPAFDPFYKVRDHYE